VVEAPPMAASRSPRLPNCSASQRAVSDLARRGIVARAGSGYGLAARVKRYCGQLATGRSGEGVGDHRAGMTRRVVVTRGFCEMTGQQFAQASSHRPLRVLGATKGRTTSSASQLSLRAKNNMIFSVNPLRCYRLELFYRHFSSLPFG
jgi:hypothetical protein